MPWRSGRRGVLTYACGVGVRGPPRLARLCRRRGKRPVKLGRSADAVAGGAASSGQFRIRPTQPLARRRGNRVVGMARFRAVRPFRPGPTGYDSFLVPTILPLAVSLTHSHSLRARTPCVDSKTFVAQAPRPVRGRGVGRIACVWRLAPHRSKMWEYTSNPRFGEAPTQAKTP